MKRAGLARLSFLFAPMKAPAGVPGAITVEISPDGMFWMPEGTGFFVPKVKTRK